MIPPPPRSTLFPYTTLFRSIERAVVLSSGVNIGVDLLPESVLGESSIPVLAEESSDRKSTRLNSSHVSISYAVFCLKKKNNLSHGTAVFHMLSYVRRPLKFR